MEDCEPDRTAAWDASGGRDRFADDAQGPEAQAAGRDVAGRQTYGLGGEQKRGRDAARTALSPEAVGDAVPSLDSRGGSETRGRRQRDLGCGTRAGLTFGAENE